VVAVQGLDDGRSDLPGPEDDDLHARSLAPEQVSAPAK
jgi:hypothetical protein